jgi:DNA-binding beta-propeller fold protein YncE
METVKFRQSKLSLPVVLCLIGLFMVGMTAFASRTAAQDATLKLEVVWKADTSALPILNFSNIAVDGQGNLFVTDYGVDEHTYQIHKFDPDGNYVMSWGSTGDGPGEFNWRPDNPDDGPDAGFIAADQEGNIYVSDGYNFRVQKFNSNGEFLLEWGSQGEEDGQFVPPGAGPISVDPQGNVYVPDFAHVQIFDSEGQFLSKFGTFGTNDGEFQGASQVGWDSQGNLYVTDLLNARFQKFDADGQFLFSVGTAGEGDGEFFLPLQAVVDGQDHVFVTDNSNRLQVFDTDGNFIAQWTSSDVEEKPFELVGSIAIDGEDNLYISLFRETDGLAFYKFRQG